MRMGFLLRSFPTQVGLRGEWWSVGPVNNNNNCGFFVLKKLKRILKETDYDNETEARFPRFIIIESTETLITNLLPSVIEKVISSNIKPITVKKLKNQILLVEVEKRNQDDFLLKMIRFHNITVKTYPHKSLNINKAAVRSKELSLCTIEAIKREMRKQDKHSLHFCEESVNQKREESNRNEHLYDIRPVPNTDK